MTYTQFTAIFSQDDCIGRDDTSDPDTIATFFKKGDTVGESRYIRATTQTVCKILHGEKKDMVVYWYTVRPMTESRKEVKRLLQDSYDNLQKALTLRDKNSHPNNDRQNENIIDARTAISKALSRL